MSKQIATPTRIQPQPQLVRPQTHNSSLRDLEGDVKMSGTHIFSIVFTVISALNNENKFRKQGQPQPLDTSPDVAHCSEEERSQRLKSGRCIRCNICPSHRFRKCKF